MRKNGDKIDGLKCDVVIYDEVTQFTDVTTMKIKEQMKQEQKIKK
ncbi:hypothetical protein [Bacillus mycoides]